MSYAFHDIKHIVEPYLDDLPTHSSGQSDYFGNLKAIFIICRFYRIRLNPHKCIFAIESGQLLSFVVSKDEIWVDPLKIKLSLIYLHLIIWHNSKVCRGKRTLFAISFVTKLRLPKDLCNCCRKTLLLSRMMFINNILTLLSMHWPICLYCILWIMHRTTSFT
jgi:hypothetical protein